MGETSVKRLSNNDLLRIVAAFAVILIHVNWNYVGRVYDTPSGSVEWTAGALIKFSYQVFSTGICDDFGSFYSSK